MSSTALPIAKNISSKLVRLLHFFPTSGGADDIDYSTHWAEHPTVRVNSLSRTFYRLHLSSYTFPDCCRLLRPLPSQTAEISKPSCKIRYRPPIISYKLHIAFKFTFNSSFSTKVSLFLCFLDCFNLFIELGYCCSEVLQRTRNQLDGTRDASLVGSRRS
jgi:hypothetical protein